MIIAEISWMFVLIEHNGIYWRIFSYFAEKFLEVCVIRNKPIVKLENKT